MGQRSQIYIRIPILNSNKEEIGKRLIARYFQWNFGERMVSRAWALINELEYASKYSDWYYTDANNIKKLERLCDVNFDYKDITLSQNVLSDLFLCGPNFNLNQAIFEEQDNNDGKLFIDFSADGKIKYAFTDHQMKSVLTAMQYYLWDTDVVFNSTIKTPTTYKNFLMILGVEPTNDPNEIDYKALFRDCSSIDNNKKIKLMTNIELIKFINYDYSRSLKFKAEYWI